MISGRFVRSLARLVAGAVLLSGVVLAAEEDPRVRLPDDPLSGRKVFVEKRCNHCHAVWESGGGLGPDLGDGTSWQSVMQLAGALWNHSPEMIEKMRERRMARAEISTKEMADLSAFLYFLDYFDPPGDPVRGRALFAEKRCDSCHAVGGAGGDTGPPLDGYGRFASALFLARAMWSHGPAMARTMARKGIPRPELAGRDLADLLAHLQQASSERDGERIYMIPGSPAHGERLFADKGCARCHASAGGRPPIGPALGKSAAHRSVTEIAGLMWNHGPRMWRTMADLGVPVPALSDDEISHLVAYVFFLQYFDPPGDPERGREVFVDKGCVLCHYAPEGAERLLAPDLTRSPAIASPVALAASMWNHAPAMEQQFVERGLSWPRFRGDDVRDLVEYLRSARRR